MDDNPDQLTKVPLAPFQTKANPNSNNLSRNKEEGELSSSSDDDEIANETATQLDDRSSLQNVPIQTAQVKKNLQHGKAAKSVSISNEARFGEASRSYVQPNHCEKFQKNRVPFVISFSDDDSGSDFEECGQEKACKANHDTFRAARSRRLPVASVSNFQMFPGNAKKGAMLPRKGSLSRTFTSSMMKSNVVSSKNGGHVKNIDPINKNKAEQDHERNQNVTLNSSKLQDLRQLIAIRENELKLRTAKKKESTSGSYKNESATNSTNRAAKICGEAHDDFVQYELKEPNAKRLKVGDTHSLPVNTGGRQGTSISIDGSRGNHVVQYADPSTRVIDRPVDTSQKTSHTAELRHPVETNHQPPLTSVSKASLIHNSSKISGLHQFTHPAKAIEPVSKDTYQVCPDHIPNNMETFDPSQNNLNIWNNLGKLNTSGTSNMDLQTLVEVEELHDKELEEAQEYRRTCEVEERNALKAYRKAQLALMEANSRCAQIYRKREHFSAHFRSHMMENPSMFFSSNLNDCLGDQPNSLNNMPEVNLHEVPSGFQMESELCANNQRENDSNVRSANVGQQNVAGLREDIQDLAVNPCSEPDTSMFWSSSLHDHLGEGPSSFSDMPNVNLHVAPSGHLMESELYAHNQGNDTDVRYANAAQQDVSSQHEDRQDYVVNASSEKDAGISDPENNNVEANEGSQSSDFNMSVEDGDETFTINQAANDSDLEHRRKDDSQDSLLLEASLRSQLFARLGIKNSLNKKGLGQKLNAETESCAHDDNEDSAEPSMVNLPFSDTERDLSFDLGGGERVETTPSELPVQMKNKFHVEKFSSNYEYTSADVPSDDNLLINAYPTLRSNSFLNPILQSAFVHMRVVDVVSLVQSQIACQNIHPNVYDEKTSGDSHYEIESISSNTISMEETSMDICFSEVGFYSSNPEIDPIWPLCMYELRGKCNDDECAWQHVRDHSCRSSSIDNATGGQVTAPSVGIMSSGATKFSKSLDLLGIAPPSYLVCTDILKADLRAYKSVLGQSEACCWQKNFSASLVLSSLLPTGLPSDEPFLHGPGARIESYGSWNRQSSYFHSRQGTMSQLHQNWPDNDEPLEMALVVLNQEVNKQKGRIEALKVLARALEADPTSAILWIVYLHIYYCNQKSIGKDDMFKYAVENNGISYELWLMYINSREQLDDRLIAYDTALSALSSDASPDRDEVHVSECILDLFLQMMNTLCISGKVSKAIEKLYGLFPYGTDSCEPHRLFDVIASLTIWDKCIFWVCCLYLVIYEKLPDAVVSRFECQKELLAMEWVSTQLTADKKQQAISLMEMAVDSLGLDRDRESHRSETFLKAAHMFALNHIRCVAVVEGLECSRKLLDKYIKLYPSYLELALMAARAHELEPENTSFAGFEKALSNWLQEVPGVQCIWNQYAECALQSGREHFGKTLMDRWFHSVWKVKFSQHDTLDTLDAEKSPGSQYSDAHICTAGDIDFSFGLLNLSLYKLLQNDSTEARSAIDRALKCASAENYKHCVKEHAMFWLTDGLQSKDAPASEMLKILKGYLANANAVPARELLSRKFIQTIKKSRVRQLVSNLFCGVSSDFSLVNLVLEVCYGPCLLPQKYDRLTDLVDLVESIMEILPANYQLAISVCKLLSRSDNSAVVPSSVSFWASSILVNALFQTVPLAPEYVWVEAASVLHNLSVIQSISDSFHKRALAVYPFSMKLWNSYLALCKITGDGSAVKEEAARRGLELD